MTFKVGDKIRGTSDTHIILDTRMQLAEVIELFKINDSKNGMVIKIIKHTDKTKIGLKYWVYNLDMGFELVEEKEMDKIEELEKKYKELGEEIERLKKEQEHKPRYKEKYWFISLSNGVLSCLWFDDLIDKTRYELGNVFKTKEEAEFRFEQIKVEAVLKRFARHFVVDKGNFMLRYDHYRNEILIEDFGFIQFSNIYFPTKEIAKKAIDTIGEERIKKYYFGVNG